MHGNDTQMFSMYNIGTTEGRCAWRERTLGILTVYTLNSYLFHNLGVATNVFIVILFKFLVLLEYFTVIFN